MSSLEQKPRFRLVDRDHEMTLLSGALERASGAGTAIVLTGEPGIGKTRLASELTDSARKGEALIAWGRAWESGGAPAYWPWTQILREVYEQTTADVFTEACGERLELIARIMPELARSPRATGAPSGDDDRFALFDAVASTLRRLSQRSTLVLVFDDLHAADEASVQLVEFVVRGLGPTDQTLVVVCMEVSARAPRLEAVHGTIAREHTSVPLGRLGPDAIAEIYAEIVGSAPASGVLETIMEASEGNPFFAIEMTRVLQAQEEPHRPDHSRGFRVPRGARELLGARTADISEEMRLVLSVGAVIGREFNASTVAEVSSIGESLVLGILEEAVRTGILREISSLGRFGFSHTMMREVFYEDLPMSDRMRVHAGVATELERRYADDIDHHIDEIAHHYFKAAQAGDKAKTLDYALRAAQRANAQLAHQEAARLYERALKVAELAGVSGGKRSRIANDLKRAQRLAEDSPQPSVEVTTTERSRLVKEGDYWTVNFDGTQFGLRDSKGLHYLAQLLKNPGREIHALELIGLVAGASAEPAGVYDAGLTTAGELGEVLDPAAKTAYKARLEELREEAETARTFNDGERAARAQVELDTLVDHLEKATGLGGRTRKVGGEAERARTSVTKAIKGAVGRIAASSEVLGRHLDTTLRTGLYCSYNPDERVPVNWEVR